MKIVDVAIKYNFNYEQTYIRCFKGEYGITPSRFRNQHVQVKIVEKMDLHLCKDIESGILFKPQFVVRPKLKLIGIKDLVRDEENLTNNIVNHRGVDFFYHHRHKISNPVNPNVYIGLTRWVDNHVDYSYYMPSIQVSSFEDVPKDMSCDTIPASKYAVFHYLGNHSVNDISIFTMETLYAYIFQTWVREQGYDFMMNGGFHFEEVDSDLASETYCEAKIYLPIKE